MSSPIISAGTNGDGAFPESSLGFSDGTFYGTAYEGGAWNAGTIFALSSDGVRFTNLHSFALFSDDGNTPKSGVILAGGTLYGTAEYGGASGQGTIFAVNTDGSGFTNFYNFTGGADGGYPECLLAVAGNTLFGTTLRGGAAGYGVVFSVNTNGANFSTLHYFTGKGGDGALPQSGVILAGGTLYGATLLGGASGSGMVYAVNTDSTWFTNLYSFTGGVDGAAPLASLKLIGNMLYGTASAGGSASNGVVFAVGTNGLDFTNLHSFAQTNGLLGVNADGACPQASFSAAGGILYGTTQLGGATGNGTIFRINADGSGFKKLYDFAAGVDGGSPEAGVILSGGSLYGTANKGGLAGNGVVFGLNIRPQVTLTALPGSLVLTWPTNAGPFTLQSCSNLTSAWYNMTNVSAQVGGQMSATDTFSASQKFYRLIQ